MSKKGSILTFVLVFGFVFLILFGGLVSLIIGQHRIFQKKSAYDSAIHIAEAGLNYYRWHLAHSPKDFCDGLPVSDPKCQTAPYGPFERDYKDPEGNIIGKFSLKITPTTNCLPVALIESTGWDIKFPELKRTASVKWGKPSLTKYSFLTNNNAWFGGDEELKGPFHSNGGIRMDGEQNSLSTSAREKYICGSEHGCSQSKCNSPCRWIAQGCECPGIWGEGEGEESGLWSFPVPLIDFALITRDLAALKTESQNSGLYFAPSGAHGYHIKFLSGGGFYLYKVTRLKSAVWGCNIDNRCFWESNDIDRETLLGFYNFPPQCAPIFVEDRLWVDGDIKGRATIAAAKLPEIPTSMKKIIINGNINYMDANSVLGLISQSDILVPYYSPNRLEIKAVLLAQKGSVYRYYYPRGSYAIRDYIETYGSIISNKIWTFTWVNSQGKVISGYRETEMSYNPDLTYSPPPYFPVSGDYETFQWEEK